MFFKPYIPNPENEVDQAEILEVYTRWVRDEKLSVENHRYLQVLEESSDWDELKGIVEFACHKYKFDTHEIFAPSIDVKRRVRQKLIDKISTPSGFFGFLRRGLASPAQVGAETDLIFSPPVAQRTIFDKVLTFIEQGSARLKKKLFILFYSLITENLSEDQALKIAQTHLDSGGSKCMGVWFVDCGWEVDKDSIKEQLVLPDEGTPLNPFFTKELIEEDFLTSFDRNENCWFVHVSPTGVDILSGVSRVVGICKSTGKIVFDRIISAN